MTSLDEIHATITQAATQVGPAVVGLRRGSGVVAAPGRVLTVAHVVRGDDVAVTFADGRSATGRVAGLDTDLDVAVVEVDTGDVAPVVFGDPEALTIGAPVIALANPGGHGLRVTFGMVSSTGRSFRGPRGLRIAGMIEHTAPLPRGSSGGPLVDVEGRLLGLNAVRRDGGLILALPAGEATLAAGHGGGARPRLGVALAHPRAARKLRAAVGLPERDGLLVRAVVDGSPAATAGLEQGDLLVAAGGHPLAAVDDLYDAIQPGTLVLRVVRGTEERDVEITL